MFLNRDTYNHLLPVIQRFPDLLSYNTFFIVSNMPDSLLKHRHAISQHNAY